MLAESAEGQEGKAPASHPRSPTWSPGKLVHIFMSKRVLDHAAACCIACCPCPCAVTRSAACPSPCSRWLAS
uniref:Uncharacterized protein n=1 Tax=Oryza glumipatula TaxID=40148 RepID=A0A0E0ALE9_9ORYZ